MTTPRHVPSDEELRALIARIYDVIAPDNVAPEPPPEPKAEREVIREQIAAAINRLPTLERRVLLRRFGLASASLRGDSLVTIANDLHLSVAEVRRLEDHGLALIRRQDRGGR